MTVYLTPFDLMEGCVVRFSFFFLHRVLFVGRSLISGLLWESLSGLKNFCFRESWLLLSGCQPQTKKNKKIVAVEDRLRENRVSSLCTVTLMWGLDGAPFKWLSCFPFFLFIVSKKKQNKQLLFF